MTPLAEPEPLAAPSAPSAARQRLEDGETVILAIRPSMWLVMLLSWPLLVGVAVIAAVSLAARPWFGGQVGGRAVGMVCLVVGGLRVIVACFQWLGRLYVLTDRRVMRIKGVLREDCYQCPLRKISRVDLSAGAADRLVGVGNVLFERTDDKAVPDGQWVCLANPQEVRQMIEEARSRAK